MQPALSIRFAKPTDTGEIFRLIRELAEFEKLLHEVATDEATLRKSLFDEPHTAEVLLAETDGKVIGYALFFHNFSTFLGRKGMYLEDLYVSPEYRGNGFGLALFEKLKTIAKERNCGRLEWWVLDWNKNAIDFYEKQGAMPMDDWVVYRLTEDKFSNSTF